MLPEGLTSQPMYDKILNRTNALFRKKVYILRLWFTYALT